MPPNSPSNNRIFISCVSDEFEKVGAPFPGLRGQLRAYLARARINVRVQEDFPQTTGGTIRKLADEICSCAVVIHLVGEMPGAIANAAAVDDYLQHETDFLNAHPVLLGKLGNFSDISYTQWEAFIALHHGIPLLVYATDKASAYPAQQRHLDRLRLAQPPRHAALIKNDTDLLGQLIGDIHGIVHDVPKFTRKTVRSQLDKHAPRVFYGRDTELAALDAAWARETMNIYILVAWGGAGKTSLVFHWVQTRFAAKAPQWSGVERYFDWSFYSQGTGDSRQTSADLFIAKALEFFGDPNPTRGSPDERGERLAGLIRQHRTLLVLDGIEPLQYPPNDPQAGRLKDPALETLLRELANDNPGLVLITTREHLTNLEAYATTEEQKLDQLTQAATVALLRHLQIVGTDEELHAAWKDAGGHALTISLLGRFIAEAYEDRHISHYREVRFEEVDQETQGRSAFKVMIAYERWLKSGGPERQRELAVLRLTGLFDRPMTKDCLQALRAEPAIPGLTEALVKLTPQQWNIAVNRLREVDLLSVSPDAIDAHPLIREYFAAQLKQEQPKAFRAAHSRLFDFLCASAPECTNMEKLKERQNLIRVMKGVQREDKDAIRAILSMLEAFEGTLDEKFDALYRRVGLGEDAPSEQLPTLEDLQPLYQAVTHGCLAGRHQEACDKVYRDRILRGTDGDGFYSTNKLGAIGADLTAVAAFFDRSSSGPWSRVSPNLSPAAQAWLIHEAAFRLKTLGRLTEALQPMCVSGKMDAELSRSKSVAGINLSDLKQMLGRLAGAVSDIRQSIKYAEQIGDAHLRIVSHAQLADALHQSGQRDEAGTLFAKAEAMQKERQPKYDLLYSPAGFCYCDWLLASAEQAAWRKLLQQPLSPAESSLSEGLAEVERRATTTLEWVTLKNWLLDIALDHLTLARAALYRALLTDPLPQPTLDLPQVAAALKGLRKAGQMDDLPKALLTAALYHFVRGEPNVACKHLNEAWQIAERGPMPLYLADCLLLRARLWLIPPLAGSPYPWPRLC